MRKFAKTKWISVLLLYTFALNITGAEAGIRNRIRQRRTPQRASQKQTSKPALPTVQGQQPQALSGPQYPPPSVNSLRGTQNLPASNDGWVFTFDSSNGLWGPEAPSGGAGASALDDLTDVIIGSHTSGKFLRANGTNFVDANIAINDITGISVTSQSAGEVLRSNGTNFVDATLDFDDLANTTITSWSTGEVPRWNGSALVDSKLASTDLSDFAGTIVGNSGDIIGWNGTAWDDLTFNQALANAYGSSTDNYVLTADGVGGFAFEAASGGGGLTVTGTPAAGDTVVYRNDVATPGYYLQRSGAPVIDVKRAGASGSVLQGTGTISTGTATLTLTDTAAQGADASDTYDTYNIGNGVIVVGAGAAHAIAAPTSIVCAADGASNSVTYTYTVYCLTNGGGWSAESSTVNTTAGATTLTDTDANYICWKTVSGANGYGVCGRGTSNRFTCFLLNSAPTAYALTFASDAGAVASDIGKPVSMTGGHTGTLIGESSDGRTWYVLPDEYSDDTFGSAAAISVTGGTGSGTTSGAATAAHYIKDTGDATSEFVRPNRSLSRRASDESRTTDWKIHPFSASGVCYRVHHTRLQADENDPKTSATANGSVSYTNTMGAITRDGDLYMVRENGLFPVVAPTSAVADVLYATVASKSGTTLTLSANASTSVTNATVMHDDYAKVNAAITAWQSATDSSVLYFPPGDYAIYSDLPSVNVFSRWSTSGGGINYLFQPQRANGKAGSIILDKNAWVRWRSMANGANETTASVATQGVFYLNGDNEITIQGGHWTHEYMSEPVLESADANASNGQRWLNDSSTGLDQFSRQRIIRDTEFFGFPSWYREENGRGRGEGTLIENVYVEYGAADDFCYYGCYGPTIRNLHVHGVQYSRSTGLYSAAAAAINPDTLIDGCTFYRTKRDGVRMRSDNTTIVNSRFIQSGTNALLLESFTGATINGNQFINGGMVNVSTNNITFNGNILQNVQLAIAGGTKFACAGTTVHWDSNAATYFVSDTYAINITGGTGITFSGLILDNDLADGGSNPDRGITITGGSNINFNGCDIEVAGERPLGISSGVTGPLSIAGGRIYGGVSTGINFAPDSDTCQLTMTGVTIDSSGSDETMLGSNGILYCKGCTFNSPVNFTTLDSLTLDGCEMAPTGSGTCTIATAGGRLIENNWGEAPTLTGTLLYTKGNLIAGSGVSSPSALSIGANALTLPVTDYVRLDPNASNSSLSGMTARANGVEVITVNVDAGAATLTYTNNSGVTEADEFLTSTGANIGADSANKSRQWWYDGTTGKWRDK